jgi:hypothetical protein
MKVHCIHKSKHSKKENQNIQQNDLQYLPPKIFYLFYWHHHRLIKIVCFGGSGENGELPEENWWSRSWFSSRAQKFMGSCFGGRIVVWLLRWQSKTAVETISGFFFSFEKDRFFFPFPSTCPIDMVEKLNIFNQLWKYLSLSNTLFATNNFNF